MRSALPARLCVHGAPNLGWRLGVCALSALAPLVLLLWCGLHWTGDEAPIRVLRGALLLVSVVLALSCQRTEVFARATDIKWDGLQWHLRAPQAAGCTQLAQPGELHPMIDLDGWMLLRWRSSVAPRRAQWIPLSSRGVGSQWHLLRSLVHAGVGHGAAPRGTKVGALPTA